MRRRNRLEAFALVSLVMAGALAGACSGDDSPSGTDGSSPAVDGGTRPDGTPPGPDGSAARDTAPGSGTFSEITSFGSNPGALKMYAFVPAEMPAQAPLVVALHGCGENAAFFAQHSGWSTLADRKKLYMVYPQQQAANNAAACFNWFDVADHSRDQGEALSIKQMIDTMRTAHGVDPEKIFVTGLSAGGAMAVALMAAYPELFAAGAPMAGIPFGCATDLVAGQACMAGQDKTAEEWGELVRQAVSGYSGPYPRAVIFQGTADAMVDPANLTELVEQWTELHGVDQVPETTDELSGHTRMVYESAAGEAVVSAYLLQGMGHGMAVDPGTGPTQGGEPGTFYYPVNLWSAYVAATVWGAF